MSVRDWAARTQGCRDWREAVERNDLWLGARIGFIFANVVFLPVFILVMAWVFIR